MDTNALVEFQIDAGQRLIVQLLRDGFRIETAFWAKTEEEGIWFLYIASPIVEEKGLAGSYRVLQSSHQRLQGIPLSLSDIKLIGKDNPITRDVLAFLARSPGRDCNPRRWRATRRRADRRGLRVPCLSFLD